MLKPSLHLQGNRETAVFPHAMLNRLRDHGNSVLVVEHDPAVIPAAGPMSLTITVQGDPERSQAAVFQPATKRDNGGRETSLMGFVGHGCCSVRPARRRETAVRFSIRRRL